MRDSTPVVLDTNVFVAAGFARGSASAEVVARVRRGELRLVWDDATRDETEHIVRRIPPLARSTVLDVFRSEYHYIGATDVAAFGQVADPDDRKFAALAHAAGAILVTMDDHLLSQRGRMEVEVLTPRELLARIDGEEG